MKSGKTWTVATIQTVFDESLDLTTYVVTGELVYQEMVKAVTDAIETKKTCLSLWDARNGQFMDMSGHEIKDVMADLRVLASRRGPGRVAWVMSSDVDLATGRMFETMFEADEFPFQLRFFRDMSGARSWLGLDA